MASELSTELREYLKRCGLSKGTIARCNAETRMFHDLGLYGEVAEACIGVLADHYNVDLSGFEFEDYFPLSSRERTCSLVRCSGSCRLRVWLQGSAASTCR
jgi:hypothetical protein